MHSWRQFPWGNHQWRQVVRCAWRDAGYLFFDIIVVVHIWLDTCIFCHLCPVLHYSLFFLQDFNYVHSNSLEITARQIEKLNWNLIVIVIIPASLLLLLHNRLSWPAANIRQHQLSPGIGGTIGQFSSTRFVSGYYSGSFQTAKIMHLFTLFIFDFEMYFITETHW